MSGLIQPKQISRLDAALIGISGLSVSAATSDTVTTDITTAAATAGRGGTAVPVQVSTATAAGYIVSGADNRVILQGIDGGGIESPDNTEVYGRLTESGGVYTLSYYYLDASGVETVHTMTAGSVKAYFPYRFEFSQFPESALLRSNVADVQGGPSSVAKAEVSITPTATNTLPDLPVTPGSGAVSYSVNGKGEDELSGGAISRSGASLTWSAANAGYDLSVTDRVTASYLV